MASLWMLIDSFHWLDSTVHLPIGAAGYELTISGQFVFVGCVQIVSGIVWAAYELAMLLMFFEAIPRQDRAGVLTFYNFGNAAALVLGSIIGATILQSLGENHQAYLYLFAISSGVRLLTVPLLWHMPHQPVTFVQPAVRVIAVRPDDGGLDRPILPSLEK
jgi:MFS family permease